MNLPDESLPGAIARTGVTTLDGAIQYYRAVQKSDYLGLPGIKLAPEKIADLAPLLARYRRAMPQEFKNIWLLSTPEAGLFIMTHVHQRYPGVALAEYLKHQSLCRFGNRFLKNWIELVSYYELLRFRYVGFGHLEHAAPNVIVTGYN